MKSECTYSIRFIDINNETAELLTKEFTGSEITLRKSRSDAQKLIFTVSIDPRTAKIVRDVIELVAAKKIDIFMSVLPEIDSEILEVPKYVSSLLGLEPIELTLSYTFVGG